MSSPETVSFHKLPGWPCTPFKVKGEKIITVDDALCAATRGRDSALEQLNFGELTDWLLNPDNYAKVSGLLKKGGAYGVFPNSLTKRGLLAVEPGPLRRIWLTHLHPTTGWVATDDVIFMPKVATKRKQGDRWLE